MLWHPYILYMRELKGRILFLLLFINSIRTCCFFTISTEFCISFYFYFYERYRLFVVKYRPTVSCYICNNVKTYFLMCMAISVFQAWIWTFFKDSPMIHNQNLPPNMELIMKMRFYAYVFPVYHLDNLIWLICSF